MAKLKNKTNPAKGNPGKGNPGKGNPGNGNPGNGNPGNGNGGNPPGKIKKGKNHKIKVGDARSKGRKGNKLSKKYGYGRFQCEVHYDASGVWLFGPGGRPLSPRKTAFVLRNMTLPANAPQTIKKAKEQAHFNKGE